MTRKKTNQEFIDEARRVHGNKYDYNYVDYKNAHTKVTIVCPKHGPFPQTPRHHLNRRGCPSCKAEAIAKSKLKTTQQFVDEAVETHGNKYDYSRVDYVSSDEDVEIICPKHGSFPQRPIDHLRGSGCPECFGSKRSNEEEFEEKARQIHGDKYDYNHVYYKDAHTKVKIVCPIHGPFWQKPNRHLNGIGCPECSRTKRSNNEEFKGKAREVHGDKYDYNYVDYKNVKTDVKIVCPEHGPFWQIPNKHLNGIGCPECAKEKVGFWNPGFLKKHHEDKLNNPCTFYLIECYSDNERFVKVGITLNSLEERYKGGNLKDYNYSILYEQKSTLLECSELEQHILKQFKDRQYEPQYKFGGSSECLTYDALDDIVKLLEDEKEEVTKYDVGTVQ